MSFTTIVANIPLTFCRIKPARLLFGITLCFLLACSQNYSNHSTDDVKYKVSDAMGSILDSAGLTGTIIAYQAESGTWVSNDFLRADSGFIPASTFKIPNTLIGLASGAIDTSVVFVWDSTPRSLKIWEKDHNLREAFHHSCVPCYQELATMIGVETMTRYLGKYEYGNMDVRNENLHLFWLEGDSRITPKEQILFLKKLNEEKLPVDNNAMAAMKKVMLMESGPDFALYGKTGWAIRAGHNTGWFVGWVETQNGVCYFAANVEPDESFNMALFNRIRSEITLEALKAAGLL